MSDAMYTKLAKCRICESTNLLKYLDLGEMPLANSLIRPEKKSLKELKFPLQVLFCPNCSLSQLSVVVDPKVLFWGYVYRSSVSTTFKNHCKKMAADLKKYFPKKTQPLVLDIASNDGCLLNEFKTAGYSVVGVEPASNLAEIAEKNNIPTINSFWNEETAQKVAEKFGVPSVITATNVLAHVDDVNGFVKAAKIILSDKNFFMIEVPSVANIVHRNEFDTIYHEHLSYFLLKSLIELFSRNGLRVFDVDQIEIHGGTLRVFVAKKESIFTENKKSIQTILDYEKKLKLYEFGTYLSLSKNVEQLKEDLVAMLKEIKQKGQNIAAYGAAAKGNTMLNYFGIGKGLVDFIIDDTPEKQNCWTPGQHIPIYPTDYLEEKKPEYLLLLAWNFHKELIEKTPLHRARGGKYIVPIPKLKVI